MRSAPTPPTRIPTPALTSLLQETIGNAARTRRRARRLALAQTLVTAACYDLFGALGLMLTLRLLADNAPAWRVPPLGYWTCLLVTVFLGMFTAALRPPRDWYRDGSSL